MSVVITGRGRMASNMPLPMCTTEGSAVFAHPFLASHGALQFLEWHIACIEAENVQLKAKIAGLEEVINHKEQ